MENKIISPPPLFAKLVFTNGGGEQISRVLLVAKTFKLNAFTVTDAYVLQTSFCAN